MSFKDAPVELSSFWMYASSLVKSRPKGAGQTCAPDKSDIDEIQNIRALCAYHRRATVSGDRFTLGSCSIGTIVDGEVTSDCPLGSAYGLSSLVKFGSHVEVMDGWGSTVDTIKADQGVNLEVGEVEIDINRVETNEEVDEDFLLFFRHMLEESLGPNVARGERRGNADIEPKGLGVNITNIDATLVSEENRIALTVGVDAYVELGIRGVRKERFQDEVVKCSSDRFDL